MLTSPNHGRQDVTHLRPDLAVVGGGLAGTFAAISAARNGASVVLIQERPVLGGNSSSEIRVHPVGASQHGYRRDSRETGLMEELFLEVRSRSYGHKQFNGRHYPMWDVILNEMVDSEDNLTLYLNTRVIGVETAEDAIDGYDTRILRLTAIQQGTEAELLIEPALVVDATGDGFVAVQAGAPFRYGREARSEFNESWAPDEAADVVLGATIMFAAVDVGRPVPFTPPAWAHAFPDEDSLPFRPHEDVESGYWWLEWGGRLNTIADIDAIRRELHAAVFGVWDHNKNHCTVPGVRERAANYALDWIGHIPGKRESRRFEGDHILSERELLAGMNGVPEDVIAYGGWPIDLHAPDGVYSPDRPCTQPPLPGIYGIPLRSLYSRTVSNLLLAGRNISQTHVAHGSTRVMKTTAVIGEAAGTAAAIALRHNLTPRSLANCHDRVREVQQQLLRQGAYLPRIGNDDALDLARSGDARVTASSEAALKIDVTPGSDPNWEYAGISNAESAGLAKELEAHPGGRWFALAHDTGLAVVLSANELASVSLPLENTSAEPVEVHLSIRQASHLRDFVGTSTLATLNATISPGRSTVEFKAERPIAVEADVPVVFSLPATPDINWALSWQEPPGTQSGHWDAELEQWRWIHGTLGFSVTPETRPFSPRNIVSGVTRPEVATNLWISDPEQSLPQWIAIEWDHPKSIGRVELTFDSQLSGWIWEGAFPLVVREYVIEGCVEGTWRPLVEVTGNVQRRRVHTFPPQRLSSLRLNVLATHEGRTARIVELRAYAD
jgi:hypothetical protein